MPNELRSMRLAVAGRIDRALNCSASRAGCELRNQSARGGDWSHDIAQRQGCHHVVAEVRMTMTADLLIMPANANPVDGTNSPPLRYSVF